MPSPLHQIEPVTRTIAQAQASYDRLSRYYDLFSVPFERRYCRLAIDMLAVHPGQSLLELGFGTGRSLAYLTRLAGTSGKVFGVDLSLGMAAVANTHLAKQGFGRSLGLVCANAIRLPFSTQSQDALLMTFTLELFDTPEIPMVLGECHRVLRSHGLLAVVALDKPYPPPLGVTLYESFHRRFPRVVDCRPIPLERCLLEAGFQAVQVQHYRMLGLLPVAIALVSI